MEIDGDLEMRWIAIATGALLDGGDLVANWGQTTVLWLVDHDAMRPGEETRPLPLQMGRRCDHRRFGQ